MALALPGTFGVWLRSQALTYMSSDIREFKHPVPYSKQVGVLEHYTLTLTLRERE